MKKKLEKNLKICKDILFFIFLLVLILASTTNFLGRLQGKRPTIFSRSTLIVVSESMEPTYKKKEFLIMKKVDFSTINENDIITFEYDINNNGKLELVTHRVIEKQENKLIAHGDAAGEGENQTVTRENFVGKIVYNSYFIGSVLYFLIEYNILVFIMALLFVYFIVKQIKKIVDIYLEEAKRKKETK